MGAPILLDLFCGAGGCTKGYQRSGFYVIGVDVVPQVRYCGDEFYVADALQVLDALLDGGWQAQAFRFGDTERLIELEDLFAVHASPPCQAYTALNAVHRARTYPRLIEAVRERLERLGRPYVIENVMGAPLMAPTILCGSMFGLGANGRQLRRHRKFESNIFIKQPGCDHHSESIGVYGKGTCTSRYAIDADGRKRYHTRRGGYQGTVWERSTAMDIDWMNQLELREAIPPAYTRYVGSWLHQQITNLP